MILTVEQYHPPVAVRRLDKKTKVHLREVDGRFLCGKRGKGQTIDSQWEETDRSTLVAGELCTKCELGENSIARLKREVGASGTDLRGENP